MRHAFGRGTATRFVILLLCLAFVPTVTFGLPRGGGPGCVFTCDKRIDTTECKQGSNATFLAAKTCEVVSNCWVNAMDPDGPGGAPPILVVTCTYDCQMEYCVWV
jgi:hypothetical protein